MGKKSHIKNTKRCAYTNKCILGKEVILVTEAIRYVKGLGYTLFAFGEELSHQQLMEKMKEKMKII